MFKIINETNGKRLIEILKENHKELYRNIYEKERTLIVQVLTEEDEKATKNIQVLINYDNIKNEINDERFFRYHEKEITNALANNLELDNLYLSFKEYQNKVNNLNLSNELTYEQVIMYEYDEDKTIYDKDFKKMINVLKATRNLYLWGNAGNGKTTFAYNVANEIGLRLFNINSVKNEYSVKGFFDLEGNYQKSLYEEWYEKGGVLLLDEVDSYSSNGMLYLNNGIEVNSKYLTLENGEEIKKHKDCYVIACANTSGEGKTSDYIGRNAIDKAFMSRFTKVEYKEYAHIHKKILGEHYDEMNKFFKKEYKELTTRLCVKLKQLLEVFDIEELKRMMINNEIEL